MTTEDNQTTTSNGAKEMTPSSPKKESVKSPTKEKSKSTPETTAVRTSGRSRHKVTRFDPDENKLSEEKEENSAKPPEGNGIPLGDIPTACSILNKYTANQDFVIFLHRFLYINPGRNVHRKKSIRAFKGFVWTDKFTRDKAFTRLSDKKWTVALLKELCEFLEIEKSGDRETLKNRIMDFLEEPQASNKKRKSQVKKSSSRKGKRAKNSKKTGKKRPLTAYFLFSKDYREEVKEENPSFQVTDVARELGSRWRNLSAKEKKVYEDKAKKLKEKFDAEMAGEEEGNEEGSGTESEEEEEEEDSE